MTPGADGEALRPDALPEGLERLLSDPEFQSRFRTVLAGLKASARSEDPPNDDGAPEENDGNAPAPANAEEAFPTASVPDSDGLASVLSDPALLGMLPGLLGGQPPSGPPAPRPTGPEQRRRDLLLALKPFLSRERGEAIDMILKISQLGSVIRAIR